MASESVQILIEAEDKASAKVAAAAQAIDQNIKSVKDTGAKAKASTEFIGVLAGQLGGTELASYAGQLAGVTEKVGQFSEMQKVAGAGAFAFQAGIALLVTTMSFKLGQSIGEMIFGIQDSQKAFRDAVVEAEAYSNALVQAGNQKFSDQLEDIQLIRDPAGKRQAASDLFESIEKGISDATESMIYYQNQVDAMDASAGVMGLSDEQMDIRNQLQQQANLQVDLIDSQREHLASVSKQFGARARLVQEIKAQQQAEDEAEAKRKQISDNSKSQMQALRQQYNELTMSAEDAKMAQLLAAGASAQDAQIIVNLQKMVDLEKEKADAKKKADEEEKARIQKIDDLRKSELERLQEQKIAIEQGEQAAHAFRLQQQGLDQGTAEAIAAAQAAMDASKEKKDSKAIEQTSNAAFESRLLSRGPREDDQKKIVENTKLTVEQLGKVEEAIKKLEPLKTPNSDRVKFEVIK